MSAALAKPEPILTGIIKTFGPWGPEYEVLGPAAPEDGKPRVRIVFVRTGEETTYGYEAMLKDPAAR
jgi:hypothetical protein